MCMVCLPFPRSVVISHVQEFDVDLLSFSPLQLLLSLSLLSSLRLALSLSPLSLLFSP